jgi:maleate cis-trans isomerase
MYLISSVSGLLASKAVTIVPAPNIITEVVLLALLVSLLVSMHGFRCALQPASNAVTVVPASNVTTEAGLLALLGGLLVSMHSFRCALHISVRGYFAKWLPMLL